VTRLKNDGFAALFYPFASTVFKRAVDDSSPASASARLHLLLIFAQEDFAMTLKMFVATSLSLLAVLATALAIYFCLPSRQLNTPIWMSANDVGAAEAERDIKQGELKLKTFGYPSKWRPLWVDLMKERLGVEVEAVAGCVVTEELAANVKGYNQRMKREIDR
jgi:hypothetical protein